MKLSCSLLIASSVVICVGIPSLAQENQDPGASGIVDGTDVKQFLNSGALIDPVRMEEAAKRFDRTIKMPQKQAKDWNEEFQREKAIKEGIPYEYTGSYTADGTSGTTGATINSNAEPHGQNEKKPPHAVHSIKNAFLRTFDFIGFPVSLEDLPGEVDDNLAGDLPTTPDPRVYVHEKKSPEQERLREQRLEQAENQPPTIMESNP